MDDELEPTVEIADLSTDESLAAIEAATLGADLVATNAELQAMLDEAAPLEAELKAAKEAQEAIRKEAQEAINLLAQKAREIDSKMFDMRRAIRVAERKKESTERQLVQAEINRKLAKEFKALSEEFEQRILDSPWFVNAMQHQIDGAKKMALGERVILGDKMGLGKTLTSLAALDMVQAKKVLAIVPNDTINNFRREVAHWAPHRKIISVAGLSKVTRRFFIDAMSREDEFIIVLNFEAWRRDWSLIEDLHALGVDAIIIDEAHNVKDMKSLTYKGVRNLVHGMGDSPKPIKYVYPMTGTPILNRPQDLFALLTLIDYHSFYNENSFLYDYCKQNIWTNKWEFRAGGLDSLAKRLAGKFIQRDRKSAGVIIPPQEVQVYDLLLDPEQYPDQHRVCKQLTQYAMIDLGDNLQITTAYMIALITRKRQAMTWPAGIKVRDLNGDVVLEVDVKESIKVDRVIKRPNGDPEWSGLIPELIGAPITQPPVGSLTHDGERVVVFSQFKAPLQEIEARCIEAGISVVRYDGDTPDDIANEVQIDFDRRLCRANDRQPKWQVVLANYKKGGVGLNFTDATQLIVLDEEWSPGKIDQAYGRIDRIGQTEETTVHVLRVISSIDTWMSQLIDDKKKMVDGFEQTTGLANALLDAMRNGEML